MRLVYLGSPEAAVPPLRALVAAGHEVVLVVSRADARRGRGAGLSPSPVKAAAIELGLPVSYRPDDVLTVAADLGVVVAYGRLIRPNLLAALPFVNLHFSLLPRWRGAAPVERAVLAGDGETGVCLMALEEGLDTGAVYRRVSTPIDPDEPVTVLRDRLVGIGTAMLIEALADGLGSAQRQVGEATYAKKLDPSEFELCFERPATELHRLVRLGVAWTTFRGRRLKVHETRLAAGDAAGDAGLLEGLNVRCGQGRLELVRVQPEGKGSMDAAAWRNGVRPTPGERLGP